MEKSESIKNLAKALGVFQGKMHSIKKDSTNPFFKSKYASLSTILDNIQKPLTECGLAVSQFPTSDNGLTTILIHAETGEYIMDTYNMRPVKDDPQGRGSTITYQRRYALGGVLGLNIDEDDDANKGSHADKAKSPMPDNTAEIKSLQKEYSKIVSGADHVLNDSDKAKYLKGYELWSESGLQVAIKKINALIKEREELLLNAELERGTK